MMPNNVYVVMSRSSDNAYALGVYFRLEDAQKHLQDIAFMTKNPQWVNDSKTSFTNNYRTYYIDSTHLYS